MRREVKLRIFTDGNGFLSRPGVELTVEGKKLEGLLFQDLVISLDKDSLVPEVRLSFVAPDLVVELEGPAELETAKEGPPPLPKVAPLGKLVGPKKWT